MSTVSSTSSFVVLVDGATLVGVVAADEDDDEPPTTSRLGELGSEGVAGRVEIDLRLKESFAILSPLILTRQRRKATHLDKELHIVLFFPRFFALPFS